jgi:SagB-type dehydrogenase family enzyme
MQIRIPGYTHCLNTSVNECPRTGAVLAYHSRTKHHLHRFAASQGYLDWATQPDPFRAFAGAEKLALPLLSHKLATAYGDLYIPGGVSPIPLDLNSVGMLFELALGLSAWKQYKETRWALRCNPSSGNLHPTEGYAILPQLPGVAGGVYHYLSRDHCLERRTILENRVQQDLSTLLPQSSLLVGLSSIHWREAWKYGERAFRYCQHDLGHAIATVRYAAAALGWSATLVRDVSDSELSDVLGLSHPESFQDIGKEDREHPGALLLVGPGPAREVDIARMRHLLNAGVWTGDANRLSPSHVSWPAIDEVAEATWREGGEKGALGIGDNAPPVDDTRTVRPSRIAAAQIIKQRRSAVALDGLTSISADCFYAMLDLLLPRPRVPPWDAWPWPPRLHCAIFVHRVEGLPPGLYFFERSAAVHDKVRTKMNPSFVFERPDGCPDHLQLYRLAGGDFRHQAEIVSCGQKIAGAGAFSLGMLAEFDDSIHSMGAWWYRRLFWEAGLLGQVLYLESEAAGVRGTGIGCYFDDAVHSLLGLKGNEFQSLYHFTVGGPVEDTRIMTLAGYTHL